MKSKHLSILPIFISLLFIGCIGDDIIQDTIDESLRIINPIDSLKQGDTYQFEVTFLNNIGKEEDRPVIWTSSDPSLLTVDGNGLASGVAKGSVTITAEVELTDKEPVRDEIQVEVADQTSVVEVTERTGTIRTTSSYTLRGDFVVKEENGTVVIDIADNYRASSALPGLYIYLTNNPSTTNGAFEIGKVQVFSGAHSYQLPADIKLDTYNYLLYFCKPFGVKVGDGEIGE